MKVAIFGTGFLYMNYKKYLSGVDIEYLIDNDIKKQGQMVDGRVINAPNEVDYSVCDFVIILTKKHEEIKVQLVNLAVEKEKILSYLDIGGLLYRNIPVITRNGEITYREWIENARRRKIMLISHELSRTGVPVALMHLGLLLKEEGYDVLYASAREGNLCEELKNKGMDYVEAFPLFINSKEFLECTKEFDLFIPGTACLCTYASIFVKFNKPILWWMHDTNKEVLTPWAEYKKLDSIYFYGGGNRVVKGLKECAGIEKVEKLLYFLPSIENTNKKEKKSIDNERIRFVLLGTISERKAQDILGEATKLVSDVYDGKYVVTFVGATFKEEQQKYDKMLRRNYPDICYRGEMTQTELDAYYSEIDVLVCPSRDDPMPIVVTQAMQHGIPCIVSDRVGQAEYIQHGINGYVFSNENVLELTSIMENILEDPKQIQNIGQKGKLIFEKYFSENSMKENIKDILKKIMGCEENSFNIGGNNDI